MKKNNQSAMTLFLLVLLSLACGGGGGGGGLTEGDEAGGSGDAGDGDAGTGTFEVDSPIDLPAPIAKGLDGIEPTSVQFTPISGQTGVAGTLTAETIGNVDATVAIIRSGEIYARKKTTGGKVEFEIPTELLGEVLALVVLAEDEETVSPPVMVQISETSSGDTVVDVLVTNTAVIQNEQIAVSSDGTIAFSALDSSNAPFIGTVSINGGSPSVLTQSPDNIIRSLRYRDNDDLWGIDTVTGIIFHPGSQTVPDQVDDPDDSFFSFSPNNQSYLFAYSDVGSLHLTWDIDIDDSFLGSTYYVTEPVVTSLQFDWLTQNLVVATKSYADGTFVLQTYELSPDTPDSVFVGPPTTLVTSTRTLANPQANRAEGDEFAYECEQASGTTGLCYYVMGINFSQTLDAGNVAHAREALDAAYVVYEKDAGSGLSDCAGTINLILDGSLTVNTIATGCYPVPHPTNSNLIAYLKPVDGKLQVGVINLSNLGL